MHIFSPGSYRWEAVLYALHMKQLGQHPTKQKKTLEWASLSEHNTFIEMPF
jgi:hypothetical protein